MLYIYLGCFSFDLYQNPYLMNQLLGNNNDNNNSYNENTNNNNSNNTTNNCIRAPGKSGVQVYYAQVIILSLTVHLCFMPARYRSKVTAC